jgi:hypothetical protein
MRTDKQGCSTCQPGREQWESFYVNPGTIRERLMIQYEYRSPEGALFTTVQSTLAKCIALKDEWESNLLFIAKFKTRSRLQVRR